MLYTYYLYSTQYIKLCHDAQNIMLCGCDGAEYHPRRKKLKYYQKRK